MIIFPLPQRKTEVNNCYHVCYRVVLKLSVNLKLIKDTQLLSLLTWLFTFPSPFFPPNPFIRPSVPLCSLSLRIWADGKGSVPPDARWSSDRGSTGKRDGWVEGEEKPKCTPAVVAQQCSLPRPVIRQRWPFPELPWKIMWIFPDLWPCLQWTAEKSPDVFLRSSSFPHHTLGSFLILKGHR